MNPALPPGSSSPGASGTAPFPPGRIIRRPGSAGGCAVATNPAETRNRTAAIPARMTSPHHHRLLPRRLHRPEHASSLSVCGRPAYPDTPRDPSNRPGVCQSGHPAFLPVSASAGLVGGYNFRGTDAFEAKYALCLRSSGLPTRRRTPDATPQLSRSVHHLRCISPRAERPPVARAIRDTGPAIGPSAHDPLRRVPSHRRRSARAPSGIVPVRPREGYRVEVFRDRLARVRMPMLSAAVSAERLFDTFLALLEPVGEVVHVVIESSHEAGADHHLDLRRDHIDAAGAGEPPLRVRRTADPRRLHRSGGHGGGTGGRGAVRRAQTLPRLRGRVWRLSAGC